MYSKYWLTKQHKTIPSTYSKYLCTFKYISKVSWFLEKEKNSGIISGNCDFSLKKKNMIYVMYFSSLDHTFPVHLFYLLYMQETGNVNITGEHYRSSAVNREFFSPLAYKKV